MRGLLDQLREVRDRTMDAGLSAASYHLEEAMAEVEIEAGTRALDDLELRREIGRRVVAGMGPEDAILDAFEEVFDLSTDEDIETITIRRRNPCNC